ncbi:MAG: hypothetical protein HC793_03330 [Aquincola sp.]|nr:hypothetical protein [Aquincola sp.]
MRRLPLAPSLRRIAAVAAASAVALLLAACQPAQETTPRYSPTPNPQPVERYKVTVEVTNAPGEFASAEGVIHFAILGDNLKCVPNSPVGAKLGPTEWRETFLLRKTSSTMFEGEVAADAFMPNDDYGLGPCTWEPVLIDARLQNRVNVHIGSVSIVWSGAAKHRIADGLYRGRRAFRLSVWDNDRLLPDDPPLKPRDSPPLFSGGHDDARKPIEPADFSTWYFITVTAQSMDPSP